MAQNCWYHEAQTDRQCSGERIREGIATAGVQRRNVFIYGCIRSKSYPIEGEPGQAGTERYQGMLGTSEVLIPGLPVVAGVPLKVTLPSQTVLLCKAESHKLVYSLQGSHESEVRCIKLLRTGTAST